MKQKKLGSQGILASELGLGCMGMSEFYGRADDNENIKVLHHALEIGVNFWDTADMYGPYTNEILVGKALKGHRSVVTLATKFGIVRSGADHQTRALNGTPAYVKQACEASLKRLNTDVIDLYYLHRRDPKTPIEDTVGAMAELVKEGKIRGIGLSEVSVETLHKAHAVHPITAVQSEYSLWSREPEEGMLAACSSMGIAFVPYSPLGRGFLTGQFKKFEDFASDDYRRFSPRFQGENFTRNLQLVEKIAELAKQKNCTPAQLALAWVMAQGDYIFPIPGTKKIKYLDENIGALAVQLTKDDLAAIDAVFPKNAAAGTRYPESMMGTLNG
ncbi:MAG: aldo/keto reductase [Hydrotalea flava]|uniref:aldo/keto reductase n=1 Tax=Hydrotalea lipotrueae TaxID=2803817 RepID=UPI001693DF3A|nr:aldo/keto reductase [Hydrotalea lipotrueae]MBY0347847.1 aldo/keto reductase [Hydrotalea flava]NIM35771.1 aldo/keto reductase [Hydrotalea flava]NIM38621.1 aldo/keto reductase [Hydrotalea flava]NIN03805.1 aldo/keto reductase [Hydrotalea flava]NIN15499.1 aldo/keto reductase [Hydrotalea flava]